MGSALSGAGSLIQMAGRKLAFVKNGDDGNHLVALNIKNGMMLDAETTKARFQMVNRKSDLRMLSQSFEAFLQPAKIQGSLAHPKLAACIGPDI